ncbi:MAG: N-acetylmuramoyl-L-alanine amidase [Pseudomonadota bacterium]
MRKWYKFWWLTGLILLALSANAQQSTVNSIRFWAAPDNTRVVFDVSAKPDYEVFVRENPWRLVIDIANARMKGRVLQPPSNHPLFKSIRRVVRNNDLRFVVDLKIAVRPKSFALDPNNTYGNRLVVDLFVNSGPPQRRAAMKSIPPKATARKTRPRVVTQQRIRDIVIAIDAGHGGEDPGARGTMGTREKDVVLAIAKKLASLVGRQPGMRPVLIRNGDYYVGLRNRMEIARKARADLFVSIHADAFTNSRVKGSSVFTLSNKGASSEVARWLADTENASDLVGGVSLDDKDDLLKEVLLDLSQTATQEASQQVAHSVLRSIGKVGALHQRRVQKAGFLVLKSPDIPSILVETTFISNPEEERKLRSEAHQERIAVAVFRGIRDHYAMNAPPGTRMAVTRHIITKGETLSGIAALYGVSMKQLRDKNALKGSRVLVGQVLDIPLES